MLVSDQITRVLFFPWHLNGLLHKGHFNIFLGIICIEMLLKNFLKHFYANYAMDNIDLLVNCITESGEGKIMVCLISKSSQFKV